VGCPQNSVVTPPTPTDTSVLKGCNHKHCRGGQGARRKGTEESSRASFLFTLPVFPLPASQVRLL